MKGLRADHQKLLTLVKQGLKADLSGTVVVSTLTLFGAILNVVFIVFSGLLVGWLWRNLPRGDLLANGSGREVILYTTAIVLAFVLMQISEAVRILFEERVGRRLNAAIRTQVMAAALTPKGLEHFHDVHLNNVVTTVRGTGQNQYPPATCVSALSSLIAIRTESIAAAILLGTLFYWWLALALFLLLMMARVPLRRRLIAMAASSNANADEARRADYFFNVGLDSSAAKEVRVLGINQWLTLKFRKHWYRSMRPMWTRRRSGMWVMMPGMVLVALIGLGGTLAIVGWTTADQTLNAAALAIAVQAVLVMANLLMVGENDLVLEYGSKSIDLALSLPSNENSGKRDRGGIRESGTDQKIHFHNVSFRYPSSKKAVLTNLNLEIKTGEFVAIVGLNGSGKTTITKLLTGLYLPTSGRITVGNVDLEQIDIDKWREKCAVVYQDFIKYPLSVEENISPKPTVAEFVKWPRLRQVASDVGLDDAIKTLPLHWSTILSREFASGTDLSAGQWQRIALARALYKIKNGANFLILDEPTSHVDGISDNRLIRKVLQAKKNLTTLLISHQLSVVRMADRIFILSDGRIVEEGSHEELVSRDGQYAEAFRRQAARLSTKVSNAYS